MANATKYTDISHAFSSVIIAHGCWFNPCPPPTTRDALSVVPFSAASQIIHINIVFIGTSSRMILGRNYSSYSHHHCHLLTFSNINMIQEKPAYTSHFDRLALYKRKMYTFIYEGSGFGLVLE